jgi:hypothetical protein
MSATEAHDIIAALDGNRFEEIEGLSDRASSFCVSASEAAHRGENRETWIFLAKAALTLTEAMKIAQAIRRDAEADVQ